MKCEPNVFRLAVWSANWIKCSCAPLGTTQLLYCEMVRWVLLQQNVAFLCKWYFCAFVLSALLNTVA